MGLKFMGQDSCVIWKEEEQTDFVEIQCFCTKQGGILKDKTPLFCSATYIFCTFLFDTKKMTSAIPQQTMSQSLKAPLVGHRFDILKNKIKNNIFN